MCSSKQLQLQLYTKDEDRILFNHETEDSISTTMFCFIQWDDHRCQFIPNSDKQHEKIHNTQQQLQRHSSSLSDKEQQQQNNEVQCLVKDDDIYATKQQQRQPKQLNRKEDEGYGTTTTRSTSMWIQRLQKKWGWKTFRKYDQYDITRNIESRKFYSKWMRLSRRMWIWSQSCHRWKVNQQCTWTRCNTKCIRDNILYIRHDHNQKRYSRERMILFCIISMIVSLIRKCYTFLYYYHHHKRTGCLLIILLLSISSSSIIGSTQSFVIDTMISMCNRNRISKNSIGNNCERLGNHHITHLFASHVRPSHSQSYQQRFRIQNNNNNNWNSIYKIQYQQQHDYDIGSTSTIVTMMMMNIKNNNNNNTNNYLDDEEYNDFYDDCNINKNENNNNNTTTNNNNNNEIAYDIGEGDLDSVLQPAGVVSDNDDDDNAEHNNNDNMNDIYWRIAKLRLEEQNIKRFLKSKPRFLPYDECRKWVQAFGRRWVNEYEWYEWIDMGEKKNPYIPSRPDQYYKSLGCWISWDHFLLPNDEND